MKELREILDFGKLKIIHEGKTKDGETMTIMARFADTKKNANGRTYPARILQKEVKKVQERIEAGGFWGMAEHPASGNQMVTGASHIIKKVWFDEKASEAWASLKIIPTVKGRDVMTLIKNGAQLGLSTRGTGDVASDGTVMDSYKMLGIDIVGTPSSQGARFNKSNIYESFNFEKTDEEKIKHKQALIDAHHRQAFDEAFGGEEGNKMKKTSEEVIQKMLKENYETTARSSREDNSIGTDKSFKQWCEEGGEAITRAAIAFHIDGEYESIEEALKEMGSPELAIEYIAEQKKVTPAECFTEARLAGVDPAIYAEVINKSVDEQVSAIKTGWSLEERKGILSEAGRAGRDISTAEKRLKILTEHKVLPETDKETLFENEVVKKHKQLTEEGEDVTLASVREVMKIDREKKEAEEIRLGKISQIVNERLMAGPNQKF